MIAQHPQQYGIPWLGSHNGLSNLEIGGLNLRQPAYRWRCGRSGVLTTFSWFCKADGASGAYSKGTGGTIKLDILADDGTALHRPTGASLATASVAPGVASAVQTMTWGTPLSVTAGTLYHYVFTNTDGSPTTNYVSEDSFDQVVSNPRQRGASDTDLAMMMNDNSAGWAINTGHTPCCFDVGYQDGYHDGVGFFDALSGSGLRDIGGANNAVRLNFTPKEDWFVTRINAGYYKQAGTTIAMDFEVYQGASKIASGQAPASAAQVTDPNWVGAILTPNPLRLQASVAYTSELWSRTETVNYKAYPLRAGAGGSGFGAAYLSDSIFLEGWWEYTINAGGAWNKEGGVQDYKPMMFFDLAEAGTTAQFQPRATGPAF